MDAKDAELSDQKREFTAIFDESESLRASLAAAMNEIERQKRAIEEKESEFEKALKNQQATNESVLFERISELEQQQRALNQELGAHRVLVTSREEEIATLQHEVSQWKKTCDSAVRERQQKDDAITSLQSRLDKLQILYDSELSDEKQAQKSQAVHTIDGLKAKVQELLSFSQKTTEALNEAEQKIKALSEKNAQLQMERQQLKSRMASVTEDCERQQHILSTRMKAMSLATEAKCHNQVEELKAKFELDKRKIFATAAERLRQFYNPRNELDDAEFARLMEIAASEITRLQTQELDIRKLLGIDRTESPDLSITRLIKAACRKS
jgi:regulator of replication initiation timing